jgi:hypothetical protein
MNAVESKIGRCEPKQTWSVVVVYENATTRERAMSVCDHLVRQFWTDIEFQFHWWRTDFLEVGDIATSAASDAAAADFVIVCAGAERELSPGVKAWFESWVGRRSGHEGALVHLPEAGPVPASQAQHI